MISALTSSVLNALKATVSLSPGPVFKPMASIGFMVIIKGTMPGGGSIFLPSSSAMVVASTRSANDDN